MLTHLGSAHDALREASRLRGMPYGPMTVLETATLVACGLTSAALVLLLDVNLRLPGHSILRAVFPMAFGLAVVPRHGAGSVMGASAITAAAALLFTGWGDRGLGSLTSLCLIGPVLDWSMRWSVSHKRVYVSFLSAGVLTNLMAFAVQLLAKSQGLDAGGGKSIMRWLPFAAITYPTCGALAGLISAMAWFQWSGRRSHPPTGPVS